MLAPICIVDTDVVCYHEADERAFFKWLDRMAFVRKYYGARRQQIIVSKMDISRSSALAHSAPQRYLARGRTACPLRRIS